VMAFSAPKVDHFPLLSRASRLTFGLYRFLRKIFACIAENFENLKDDHTPHG
jgi:hypothetical protein